MERKYEKVKLSCLGHLKRTNKISHKKNWRTEEDMIQNLLEKLMEWSKTDEPMILSTQIKERILNNI